MINFVCRKMKTRFFVSFSAMEKEKKIFFLKLIISGTLCAIESRYTDAELIITPMDNRCPLLNLFKKIPTNNGKNMYGMKLAKPMAPRSAYDAPITFFAKTGNSGP